MDATGAKGIPMDQMQSSNPLMDRIRWAAYGMVAGLVFGMVLGWMFHGFVGLIVRVFIILVILTPFVAAFLFWQKVKSSGSSPKRESMVRDADWREIDPRR
jgi:high-affinity Fe2+/Pb2+ permease